jgi:uncharacterized Rossmann fold enzyme
MLSLTNPFRFCNETVASPLHHLYRYIGYVDGNYCVMVSGQMVSNGIRFVGETVTKQSRHKNKRITVIKLPSNTKRIRESNVNL